MVQENPPPTTTELFRKACSLLTILGLWTPLLISQGIKQGSILLGYYSSTYTYGLMTAMRDNDHELVNSYLLSIFFLKVVQMVIGQMSSHYQKFNLWIPLSAGLDDFFMKKIQKTSPVWISSQNVPEVNGKRSEAVGSISSIISIACFMIEVGTQQFVTAYVAYQFVGWNILIVFATSLVLFLFGTGVVRKNYRLQSEQKKLTQPLNTFLHVISGSYPVAVLNNMGDYVTNLLIKTSTQYQTIIGETNFRQGNNRKMLEILHSGAMGVATWWICSQSSSLVLIVPVYYELNRMHNKIWWLFHQANDMVTTAADYEQWAQVLKEMKNHPRPIVSMYEVVTGMRVDLSWMPEWVKDRTKESLFQLQDIICSVPITQICGPTGQGKSTIMKLLLSMFQVHYFPCSIYVEQDTYVPESSKIKIGEYMTQMVINKSDQTTKILLKWAQILGIGNVVNVNTLTTSFKKPSGGEKKMICLLRSLLPVLEGIENGTNTIRFIMVDEVMAGLDPVLQAVVADFLKVFFKAGIHIVIIEHHDLSQWDLGCDVSRVNVFKEKPVMQKVKDDDDEDTEVGAGWLSWIFGTVPVPKVKPFVSSTRPEVWVEYDNSV